MQRDHPGPRFDPRSPVQADRSNAPYFIAALVAGIAIWTFQQISIQDSKSGSKRSSAESQSPVRDDVRTVFSNDDYPAIAIARNEQGTVQATLEIDPSGRVSRCSIIRSSGFESLDGATCRILQSRARFTPARDAQGKPVSNSYTTPPIRWVLPD